jgi:hypothetical protein
MHIIIIIIIIGKHTISFIQGIYTYILETNYVPKEYNVAAILSLLFIIIIIIIISGSTAQRGLWPPRPQGFLITHNDVPQSVGLLWTSDQIVAETST